MPSRQHDAPPRLAAALLGWLLKDEWQTPLGDFEEYFRALAEERGIRRARWWYRRQVIWLLPDRLYEKTYWGIVMLKNYLALAYRNLLKNKVTSGINIFGLSVAVGCSLVAFLFINGHLNRESIHRHADQIFQVQYVADDAGEVHTWGNAPAALGPALAADFPQVLRAVRVDDQAGTVKQGETTFNQFVRFVDPGFLDLFTFPLAHGEPGALADPDAVILSDEAALRYFGDENPIGQTLALKIGDREERLFVVRGVSHPPARRTSVGFSLLLNYANRYQAGMDPEDDWGDYITATFIQVEGPDVLPAITAQMDRYVPLQQASAREARTIDGFVFDNLQDLAFNASEVRASIAGSLPWAPIIVLTIIAGFLLVLACFNYVTIAVATASRRLKEIGIRKVLGSSRQQLVIQFLSENMLLCLLSLLLGVVLAAAFFGPAFANISGSDLSLRVQSLDLWLFLAALLVGIGLISGAYPAFYVSRFQPVVLFRGTQRRGHRSPFMQALLGVQFMLAFITMIASLGLTINAVDQRGRDWGYDRAHTLVIRLNEPQQYDLLRSEALQQPNIMSISGSHHHVGKGWRTRDVRIDAKPFTVHTFEVGPGYQETLGLRLATGQFMTEGDGGSTDDAVVINETFAAEQGWEAPIGQAIRIDSTVYTVVGVVQDFHYSGFSDAIRPMLFRPAPPATYAYLSMRLAPGTAAQTAATFEQHWERLMPADQPFTFFFQDAVFDEFFQETQGILEVFIFTAVLALLLSCMGLLGLAAQNTNMRMKEISIRKVLGASTPQVAWRVNQRFLTLLLLAAVIATPVSYFALNLLLDSIYTYRMDVGPVPFLIAYGLVFTTALLTISSQLYQVSIANPAETLRSE